MSEVELMKVVLVEPNEKPKVIEIENTLEAKQSIVKGLIESISFRDDDNCVIIGNEEAKLIGMEPNRRTDAGIICGPFFVCGVSEDNFRGLTEEEVSKYMDKFDQPETISPKEVEAELNIVFQSWF